MADWQRIRMALGDPDPAVRLEAAAACEAALGSELERRRADWEPLVSDLLPGLMGAIGDRHKGVQVHGVSCLQSLACHSAQVPAALRNAMADPNEWAAWGAAIALARTGIWYPEMAGALAGAMGATDRDVAWAAAGFILQLGRSHPEAVAMAIATLDSPNPLARKMAAYCLGAMGTYADVEEQIAGRLLDPERDVRRAAILALGKLPQISAAALAKIAALRQDPDAFVRRTAAAVIRRGRR